MSKVKTAYEVINLKPFKGVKRRVTITARQALRLSIVKEGCSTQKSECIVAVSLKLGE